MMRREFRRMVLAAALCGTTVQVGAQCTNMDGVVPTTKIRTEETDSNVTYFGTEPQVVTWGIESAVVEGFSLILSMGSQAQYVEYTAPGLKRIEVTSYEARPISTVVGNVLLLGLPLLANPSHTLKRLAGCSEEKYLDIVPDKDRQQATGKTQWHSYSMPSVFQVIVEGFPEVQSFEQKVTMQGKQVIDLQKLVMKTEILPAELKITCISCSLPVETMPIILRERTVHADFAAIKQAALEKAGMQREEEERQLKEERVAAAREAAERRAQEARAQEVRQKLAQQQRLVREKAEEEARVRKRKRDAIEQLGNL